MSSDRQGFSDSRTVITTDNTLANVPITSVIPLAESDGTLKASLYGKVGATLTAISLDDGGELEVSLMGNIASTPTQVELDTGGKLMVVNYGKDSGGNIDPLRTNAAQQQQIEVVPLETPRQVDAILIPAVEGILLDGSATLTAGGVYEVTFNVVNIDGTNAVTISVGVDLAAGGGLVTAEYFLKDVVIPAGGRTGDITLTMAADDDIRGIAGAASDASMHFTRIVRVA